MGKSKTMTLVLCVFLGVFGAHRFYVGKIGTGFLWLITGGLFGIGWIVDIIKVLRGHFTDADGHPIGTDPQVWAAQREQEIRQEQEKQERYVKSYTFEPGEILKECIFSNTSQKRQDIITWCAVGDPVSFRAYEWQGKTALAVIHDGLDIGIVKQSKDLPAILAMMDEYDIDAHIARMADTVYRGRSCISCDVKVDCYRRAQA